MALSLQNSRAASLHFLQLPHQVLPQFLFCFQRDTQTQVLIRWSPAGVWCQFVSGFTIHILPMGCKPGRFFDFIVIHISSHPCYHAVLVCLDGHQTKSGNGAFHLRSLCWRVHYKLTQAIDKFIPFRKSLEVMGFDGYERWRYPTLFSGAVKLWQV